MDTEPNSSPDAGDANELQRDVERIRSWHGDAMLRLDQARWLARLLSREYDECDEVQRCLRAILDTLGPEV